LERSENSLFADNEALLRKPSLMSEYHTALTNRLIHLKAHNESKARDPFNIESVRDKMILTKSELTFYPEYNFPMSTMPDLLSPALTYSKPPSRLDCSLSLILFIDSPLLGILYNRPSVRFPSHIRIFPSLSLVLHRFPIFPV
jgi:hypothetical protein